MMLILDVPMSIVASPSGPVVLEVRTDEMPWNVERCTSILTEGAAEELAALLLTFSARFRREVGVLTTGEKATSVSDTKG